MGGGISNFISYPLTDCSYYAQVSETGSVNIDSRVGSLTNFVDKNLTTNYYVHAQYVGLQDAKVILTLDYQKIWWNMQLFANYRAVAVSSGGGLLTMLSEYSTDGTTWTTLYNGTVNPAATYQANQITMRYLRFTASAGTSVGTQSAFIELSEIRLLGS